MMLSCKWPILSESTETIHVVVVTNGQILHGWPKMRTSISLDCPNLLYLYMTIHDSLTPGEYFMGSITEIFICPVHGSRRMIT